MAEQAVQDWPEPEFPTQLTPLMRMTVESIRDVTGVKATTEKKWAGKYRVIRAMPPGFGAEYIVQAYDKANDKWTPASLTLYELPRAVDEAQYHYDRDCANYEVVAE